MKLVPDFDRGMGIQKKSDWIPDRVGNDRMTKNSKYLWLSIRIESNYSISVPSVSVMWSLGFKKEWKK